MRHDGPWLLADWPAPPHVVAFTTLRGDAASGVSRAPFAHFNLGERCGDAADAVATNRARLADRAGLPESPRWLHQLHGTHVHRFERPHPDLSDPPPCMPTGVRGLAASLLESPAHPPQAGEGEEPPYPLLPPLAGEGVDGGAPEADASVTSETNLVLAILTADCLPVLFCAADGSEVGAAHAGWRGLAAGVLERTVAAMRTPPAEILAWLGPAAGPSAYEIGVEVREALLDADAGASDAFVATRPGHWNVDLYALARRRLAAVGVQRVSGGGPCTISDPARFYSHRRDGRSGRMASVVWIDAGA